MEMLRNDELDEETGFGQFPDCKSDSSESRIPILLTQYISTIYRCMIAKSAKPIKLLPGNYVQYRG